MEIDWRIGTDWSFAVTAYARDRVATGDCFSTVTPRQSCD